MRRAGFDTFVVVDIEQRIAMVLYGAGRHRVE